MEQFISPRTGKPIPGAFVCSHAELEAPHYQALHSPIYRQELWQMWHEVEHEPSNAFLYNEVRTYPRPVSELEQVSTPRMGPLDHRIARLQGEFIALKDTLLDHIKGKRKQVQQKTQQTTDGIEL